MNKNNCRNKKLKMSGMTKQAKISHFHCSPSIKKCTQISICQKSYKQTNKQTNKTTTTPETAAATTKKQENK